MTTSSEPAQWVRKVQLEGFRSYPQVEVTFDLGITVLYGPNGVGKTNLLEAIAYLSLGRSPRTSRDSDLVRTGAPAFRIEVRHRLERGAAEDEEALAVTYQPERGRQVWIDGSRAEGPFALFGRLIAVFFSPDDLWLLKGAPAARRALLDRLLVQAYPVYADAVLKYRQALAQRNSTLREVRARRAGRALLAIWEPQLVQYGAEILRRREEAVAALAPLAARAHSALAGAGESLALRHVPGLRETHPVGGSWEARVQGALDRDRDQDVAAAVTASGPHRDDLEATIAGRSARRFASQGQQRSAVLAIKFAERGLLRAQTGRIPLLLVDDVLSELDVRRREALLDLLAGEGQVFLTTANEQQARAIRAAALYRVAPGTIRMPDSTAG